MLDARQGGSCNPYCCVGGGVQLCEWGCLCWIWKVRGWDECLEVGGGRYSEGWYQRVIRRGVCMFSRDDVVQVS